MLDEPEAALSPSRQLPMISSIHQLVQTRSQFALRASLSLRLATVKVLPTVGKGTCIIKRSVLAIGLDPTFADIEAFPGLTPELIRSYIDAQIEKLKLSGYSVVSCLIDLGETAEEVASRALKSKSFDCVVIGAGLRHPASQLLLFEKIINLVHTLAPTAKICFNTTPVDTLDAVQRWIRAT